MSIQKIGYACINTELRAQGIQTNRGCIKRTFLEKGTSYVGELALQNFTDLLEILRWNVANDIRFFRVSSDILPWHSEYNIEDLPQFNDIESIAASIGVYVNENDIRLTTHPGPYNVLPSPREDVVNRTIRDLTCHGELFDLLGLSRTRYNKINIHCNGVYGDKRTALDRFVKNYKRLPESVKSRLTIENDDKASMYNVGDLLRLYDEVGTPIVFDYHHYLFNTGDINEEDSLKLAAMTWGDVTPVVHYSESKRLHEYDNKIKPQAHSNLISKLPETYGIDVDVMVEAKSKEQAIMPFIKERNALAL
jgi:UV DNA damage endonuclease